MFAPTVLEEATPVRVARRWVEQAAEWIDLKQSQGMYQGRIGYEARRFIGKCGTWVDVAPSRVLEEHVWRILDHVGPAPKTKRTYVALLGSFLASRGNWVVQESHIRERFPNVATRLPIVPVADRDRVLNHALGQERVITALLSIGRRRVEIQRAQVADFHMETDPATYGVRAKGGGGQVTDQLYVPEVLDRELVWWLPMRAQWSARAATDTGHLICRPQGRDLVGVSAMWIDRSLHAAERRAQVREWPAHAFRRSTATLLRERGADWEDISAALTHRSPETTRLYVDPLVRQRRLAQVLQLIDPRRNGGKA